MKHLRTALFILLTLAVMGGALAYSFHKIGTESLLQALRSAHWGYAPLAVLAGLLVYPIKALRWRLILGRGCGTRYRVLYSAIMIGFMANCIFSRLGELIRAVVVGIKGEMRVPAALASIALERIFDVCTILLFLIVALLWLHPAASGEGAARLAALRTLGAFAALILAAAVGFLALLKLRPAWTQRAMVRLFAWLPKRLRAHVENFIGSFLAGLDSVNSARQLAAILALSVVHWAMQTLCFLLAAWCFPEMGMTVPGAMLVMGVVAFGVAGVPLPGYLGIYQVSILVAGEILGMSGAAAALWVNYSWLSWALNIPFVILTGFVFLWTEKLSLRQLRTRSSAPQGARAR